MKESRLPAARAIADVVQRHTSLSAEEVEAVVNAVFWTSLRREETFIPKISLALAPMRETALRFEYPLPLTPEALARVSPAVERPGIHLGVWREDGELRVWGATRKLPAHCLVLEVVAPGLVVVKRSREEESGKFTNVVVLEGDRIKVLRRDSHGIPDCPSLVNALLAFDMRPDGKDPLNALVQLATSMRAHKRGGSLLIVPGGSTTWRESIVAPIPYAIEPSYSALSNLMKVEEGEGRDRRWHDFFNRAVETMAGLTAVDGATIITDDFRLLAFGAKIRRRDGSPPVDRVIMTEPVEGGQPVIVDPAQLGGTRHLSAAQFASDQPDGSALVASQDGRFTVFSWSACEEMVHAHRVEVLLL